MAIALEAATLLTPDQVIPDGRLLIEDGRIVRLGSRADFPLPSTALLHRFPDACLAPGLLDIHIHGGAGHDVMEATTAAFDAVGTQLAQHGITSYYPTTVTASREHTCQALARLADLIEQWPLAGKPGIARPLGIHLEGPFLSHRRRGVHPEQHLLEPTEERFLEFFAAARERIAIMTIAPELPQAPTVITLATQRGVLVSLGHTDSTTAQARAGLAAGARHVTHVFNAMRPLNHREPGLVGLALGDPTLSAEIIADGLHVDPLVVATFLRAKGEDHAVLVTDAISATGMGDGHFRLGELDVQVHGSLCTSGETLAGSVLSLDLAVRNAMKFAGWDLARAIKTATRNPARLLGWTNRPDARGLLAPGALADLVVLSPDGHVRQTILQGHVR